MFNYIYDLTENKNIEDEEGNFFILGNTALFIAAQHDKLDFMKFLDTKGYDFKHVR